MALWHNLLRKLNYPRKQFKEVGIVKQKLRPVLLALQTIENERKKMVYGYNIIKMSSETQ